MLWFTCFDCYRRGKEWASLLSALGIFIYNSASIQNCNLGRGRSDFRSEGWHLCVKPNRWQRPFHRHIENSLRAVARAVWQKQLWLHKFWWLCPNSVSCYLGCGMPRTRVMVWIGSASSWKGHRKVKKSRGGYGRSKKAIGSSLEVCFKVNQIY